MEIDKIKKMIKLMNDNELAELEWESKDQRIRLRKKEQQIHQAVHHVSSAESVGFSSTPSIKTDVQPQDTVDSSAGEVKAPMVGTFYRAPAPGAEAFVSVGQTVEVGQVVCIIEAMKLMNEIKTDVKGVIKEILVENAEAVEYGQVLFRVQL